MPSFPTRLQRDTLFYLLDVDYTFDALMSGTRILIVGDPRVTAVFPDRSDLPFLHWTGYNFIWESTGGDTIEVMITFDQFNLQNYLSRITRWEYALKIATKSSAFQYASILKSFKTAGQSLRLMRIDLARNRIGELISFALRLQIYIERSDGSSSNELESILFVPFGDLEPSEALRFILKEALDISIAQESPKWTEKMVTPGQAAVDASISKIEDEIAERAASLQLIKDERKELRNCLEVLYQMGSPLETAVQSLLKELGCAVEQPKEKNRCDCYLTVIIGNSENKAALEIKGTNRFQFDMKGFKQVLQWRNEAILEHDEEYRGIFIGNSAIEIPPDSREDPFGDGWKKQAKLHKVTVLTTSTLYNAYCAHKRGALRITHFWKALFETDGVFELDSALIDDEPPLKADQFNE
jgi:hypothetical protein